MPDECVTREQVIAAAMAILGDVAYNNICHSSGCTMAWTMAAVKAFISESYPDPSQVLRRGLKQLEKVGYLR